MAYPLKICRSFSVLGNILVCSVLSYKSLVCRSAAYVRQLALKQQKGDEDQLMKGQHRKSPMKQPEASREDEANNGEGASSKKEKYELSSLVKSIKMKSKQLQLQSGGGKMPKKDGKERLRVTEEPQLPTMNKSIKKKKHRKTKDMAD